jgi:hypothetical protein
MGGIFQRLLPDSQFVPFAPSYQYMTNIKESSFTRIKRILVFCNFNVSSNVVRLRDPICV